jgi:hypothetical protein
VDKIELQTSKGLWTCQFGKLGFKRHAKIQATRQKTDDVKIGRHMKGWTLCQKETLPPPPVWLLPEFIFGIQATLSQ